MTEVTPAGRMWRFTMYAWCVVMVPSGPGFLALALLLDANRWASIVISGALTAILVPLGVALWRDVQRTGRRMRRLRMVGVPATAEVLAIRPTGHDDGTRVELDLWISAPDIEPFEAFHTRDGGADVEVGATLGAVVDTSARLYAVV